jgi:hypothetical protein
MFATGGRERDRRDHPDIPAVRGPRLREPLLHGPPPPTSNRGHRSITPGPGSFDAGVPGVGLDRCEVVVAASRSRVVDDAP